MESTRSNGRSTVRNGLITGVSTAAVSGSAAVLGVILSRKFGHGVKTDGFFAAYGVYLALVLVASTLRVVVLPRFATARVENRLGNEVAGWAVALALPLAVAVVVGVAWPHGVASLITSEPQARDEAATLLPWVVVSAVAQIYGGLVASALAALDDYAWAAFGFAFGSVAGVVLTVSLVDHGVIAFGWGLALNGVASFLIPLIPFIRRHPLAVPPPGSLKRLVELGEAVSVPLALQGLYLIGLRFASGLGPGEGTTFSYAYLIAAFFVAVTAASVALVATVPFVRAGVSPERASRHIVAVSWISLALVAAAAGIFAVAGQPVVRYVLGSSYGGDTGSELGRLVVYLAPWMVTSVASTVAFPLVFARGRARILPLLAVVALLVHVPIEWVGKELFGLGGLAAGMAVTSALVLVGILSTLGAVGRVVHGVAIAAVACGAIAFVAFALPHAVLGPLAAAVIGLVAYSATLALWRPAGLRTAWAYVRTLQ
jgi:hypothetical protein